MVEPVETHVRELSRRRTTVSPACRKDLARGRVQALVRTGGSFLDPQFEHGETCSTAEATRGHHACVHAVLGGLLLADPGITTQPRGLTSTQSRLADLFATSAVPGRSAALDVCVASPDAAAARGDAAQAAFDRHEIPDLRNQGIHCQPLVWTADGRPHPAVTRTLQYAADIASSRNGQQMSAKSLQHRRKPEIKMPSFFRLERNGFSPATTILLPSPVNRLCLCSRQASDVPICHGGAVSHPHLGSPQLRACNSHSSNGAFLSGKNDNFNSSITRLCLQSYSLMVRISL